MKVLTTGSVKVTKNDTMKCCLELERTGSFSQFPTNFFFNRQKPQQNCFL